MDRFAVLSHVEKLDRIMAHWIYTILSLFWRSLKLHIGMLRLHYFTSVQTSTHPVQVFMRGGGGWSLKQKQWLAMKG